MLSDLGHLLNEWTMLNKNADNIGISHSATEGRQFNTRTLQLGRQFVDIGFYSVDLATQAGNLLGNTNSRAFTQIIDIGFEGQAQACHFDIRHACIRTQRQYSGNSSFNFLYNPLWFVVVNLASQAHNASLFRSLVHDEPRINGDAVTTHSGTGCRSWASWLKRRIGPYFR